MKQYYNTRLGLVLPTKAIVEASALNGKIATHQFLKRATKRGVTISEKWLASLLYLASKGE